MREDNDSCGQPRERSKVRPGCWVPAASVLVVLCLATTMAAPDPSPPPGNRYLFIVDTCSSMKRLATPLRSALFELIENGLEGRMKGGDTYGVWTCSDQVVTDFPMQVWNEKERLILAYRASEFIKKQRLAKPGRLDPAVSGLLTIVNSVKDVTALILTDGEDPVKGTPYDLEINAAVKNVAAAMHRDKKPVVVALVAQGGQIVQWGVNSPESLLLLPKPIVPPQPILAKASDLSTNALLQTNLVPPAPSQPVIVTQAVAATSGATDKPSLPKNEDRFISTESTNPPTVVREKSPVRRAPIIITRDSLPPKAWAGVATDTVVTVEPARPRQTALSNPPPAAADARSTSATNVPSASAPTNSEPPGPRTASVAAPLTEAPVKLATSSPRAAGSTAAMAVVPAPGPLSTTLPPRLVRETSPALSPSVPARREAPPAGPASPAYSFAERFGIGLGFACGLVLLGALFWRWRSARHQPSLITSSMDRGGG